MASVFPGAIDSFTDPLSTSPLNSPSHAGQHQDLNDAVEKVETYMGLVLVKSQAIVSGTNTVTDCFTTLYEDYLLVIANLKTASNNSALWVGLNGNPTVKSNGIYLGIASATVNGDPQSSTNGFLAGFTHTIGASYHVRISQPRTTAVTTFSSQWATSSFVGSYSGIEETGVGYTGLVITGGSTISATGTIRVYGYRK